LPKYYVTIIIIIYLFVITYLVTQNNIIYIM